MATKAVFMRKAQEILRLRREAGLGIREMSRSLRISHGTVVNYLHRSGAADLSWPLPEGTDDADLQCLLFASDKPATEARRPLPVMSEVQKELQRSKREALVTGTPECGQLAPPAPQAAGDGVGVERSG